MLDEDKAREMAANVARLLEVHKKQHEHCFGTDFTERKWGKKLLALSLHPLDEGHVDFT